MVPRQHTRNGKLVSWSQPPGRASIHSRKRRVKLPTKQGCGLRSVHRARRIVRMTTHSHHDDHVHAGHSHVHDHGHAGRAHSTLRPSVLGWAMAATLGLVVAEVFGGILGRSVALLNDALHNLSDVPALGISYLAMRWAERPRTAKRPTATIAPARLLLSPMLLCSFCFRFGSATKPSSASGPLWKSSKAG